jgi:putative Mn2+ efflux pump MntP
MLRLLLFVLPLGLDTLGVSISLGIKSSLSEASSKGKSEIPAWLASALLFSATETLMPLVGLAIGYAASLVISDIMHLVGPLLLIAVGLWELQEEIRERINRRKSSSASVGTGVGTMWGGGLYGCPPSPAGRPLSSRSTRQPRATIKAHPTHPNHPRPYGILGWCLRLMPIRRPYWFPWGRQLLLTLSISLDELAIGFSLGAVSLSLPGGKAISPITLCLVIGLQGFIITLIGLTLGRALGTQLKPVKEWLELLSGFLLIGLGTWLFLT